jgi:hypothetical protein
MLSLMLMIVLAVSGLACTQAYGATPGTSIVPADRKVDWALAGIPGGIPERKQVFRTIDAARYGNGSTDATRDGGKGVKACFLNNMCFDPFFPL